MLGCTNVPCMTALAGHNTWEVLNIQYDSDIHLCDIDEEPLSKMFSSLSRLDKIAHLQLVCLLGTIWYTQNSYQSSVSR